MKINRSCKIYYSHLTKSKKDILKLILKEYHAVVTQFIDLYQEVVPDKSKRDITLKEPLSKVSTWLSSRMIQNAFSEGWSLVDSNKKSCIKLKTKYTTPKHNPNRMVLSSQIVNICLNPKTKMFDLNVRLNSIGNKIALSIPLKKHRLFNKWLSKGKLSKSIIITDSYIQFSFELNIEYKKEDGYLLGVDIGIKNLLATSDGKVYGTKIESLIKKLHRKKQKSAAYYNCKIEIEEYINKTIKELPWDSIRLLVVENLKSLKKRVTNKNKKGKRRLPKYMRRVIHDWNYRYILKRLEAHCQENRVSFRSVSPWNTSITCSICGHMDKGNRLSQELFCCTKCGHSENADINASKMTLSRFLTGKYGSGFKVL